MARGPFRKLSDPPPPPKFPLPAESSSSSSLLLWLDRNFRWREEIDDRRRRTCSYTTRHKFHSRLDTFDVSSPCILAVSSSSNRTARHAHLDVLDTSNVSSRDVTSQVELGFSG